MKRTFLIGRFLPSHAGVYRYTPPIRGSHAHLSKDTLRRSFRDRAVRFRMEQGRYAFHLQAGFAVALLVVIGAFNLDLRPQDPVPVMLDTQELVTIQEILQTRQEVTPPPPPRPPIPIEVPDDMILEGDDLPLGDPLDLVLLTAPPPPAPEKEEPEVEDEIFMVVEQMPAIVGGQAALHASLTYPMVAQQAGIEGMVVIEVIIEPDGSPAEPKVISSVHEVLDDEAVAAVMAQEYTPGRQRGRAVRVRLAIPVKFQLRSR